LLQEDRSRLGRSERRIEALEVEKRELGETVAAIGDAKASLQRERDEARELHQSALRDVNALEAQIRAKDQSINDLRRKYDLVNQEYLGLMNRSRTSTPGIL
jgi:chromosome segregation ATPase